MLIDLYVEAPEEGTNLEINEMRQQIDENGIDAMTLVGKDKLPKVGDLVQAEDLPENFRIFTGAVINVGEARLWVMPPSSDVDLPTELNDNPTTVANQLSENGWAVLLCNPYARELPGGELRDRAINLSGVHGVLSFVAAAQFQENLLAQELAMAQRKVAAAGTGSSSNHPEFGRYFTLALSNIGSQQDLVEAIRDGRVLPVESTLIGFSPIEAAMRPRDGNRRDGGRDRNDRTRQGRSGRGDRRPRDRQPRNDNQQ